MSAAGTGRPRALRPEGAVDLAVVAVLVLVATAGFGPSWGGIGGYLPTVLGGLVLGLAVAWVAAWRRVGVVGTALATAVGYLALGGALALPGTAVAGVLPTAATIRGLALGAVTSWKDVLTVQPPLDTYPELRVLPFLVTLLATVTAGSIALRARRPVWALLPTGLLLVAVAALGTNEAAWPVLQGVATLVVGLGWASWRTSAARAAAAGVEGLGDDPGPAARDRPARSARPAGGGAAGAGGGGDARRGGRRRGAGGPGLGAPTTARSCATSSCRRSTCTTTRRPWPLSAATCATARTRTCSRWTACRPARGCGSRRSTPTPARSWTSPAGRPRAGPGRSCASARSCPCPARRPQGPHRGPARPRRGVPRVWVPGAGVPTAVRRFTGDRAAELRQSLHANPDAATVLTTAGLAEGDTYDLAATLPPAVDPGRLEGVGFADVRLPDPEDVPDSVSATADAYVGRETDPVTQVRLLRDGLVTSGMLSHGLEGQPSSRPGHGSGRIDELLTDRRMVGDDEQFAVAMTLMARTLGIPARVVLGFYPTEDVPADGAPYTVHGSDVHAWVEVAFRGHGWVPFDVLPDEEVPPVDQDPRSRASRSRSSWSSRRRPRSPRLRPRRPRPGTPPTTTPPTRERAGVGTPRSSRP